MAEDPDECMRKAMEACGESLRKAWRDSSHRLGHAKERPRSYTISFDAAPSVGERIKQYIADQPTANRRCRHYEIPDSEIERRTR